MKKILIIGGDSFVAKNFISELSDVYQITVVSRKSTGYKNEVLSVDFKDIADDIFAKHDIVFNCAAIVHLNEKKVNPCLYFDVNHKLAVHNAQKAQQNGCSVFVQMSTIAVYGEISTIDNSTVENPQTQYGSSKLLADNFLLSMQSEKFRVILFRPPMIYGNGAPGNMLKLIQLVHKFSVLPFKSANEKRDFIHIRNFLFFLNIAIENNFQGVLLVSDNHGISTKELVQIIASSANIKLKLFSIPKIFFQLMNMKFKKTLSKLFGNLKIEISQPFEPYLKDLPVLPTHGIKEMVENFKSK